MTIIDDELALFFVIRNLFRFCFNPRINFMQFTECTKSIFLFVTISHIDKSELTSLTKRKKVTPETV